MYHFNFKVYSIFAYWESSVTFCSFNFGSNVFDLVEVPKGYNKLVTRLMKKANKINLPIFLFIETFYEFNEH